MQTLWVIQELALAKDVGVFCGLVSLQWDVFARFCVSLDKLQESFISTSPVDPRLMGMARCRHRGLFSVLEHGLLRGQRLSSYSTVDFMGIVQMGRWKECKNPVDRVYGLLGLAEGVDEMFREIIPIDYS